MRVPPADAPPRACGRPAPRTAPTRLAWGRVADAIGHCLLVFVFVPLVATLPGWLSFEATNALNLQDPIVLVFAPVRGIVRVLNALLAGLPSGLVGGIAAGALLTLVTWRAPAGSSSHPVLAGAGCGAAAGIVVIAWALVPAVGGAGEIAARLGAVAFELGSGVVCGMIAAPTAVRWLTEPAG